jgi:hypothetical protein
VDPLAVEGFQTILWELAERAEAWHAASDDGAGVAAPLPRDVFVFASSGASFVALGRASARLATLTDGSWRPRLHVVQGTGAHPIAGQLDTRPVPASRGRVGALGARKTRRVGEAVRTARDSGGGGWVVTDDEAEDAARILRACGITTSLEGAASLAAARRAVRTSGLCEATVILTGRHRGAAVEPGVSGAAAASGEDPSAQVPIEGAVANDTAAGDADATFAGATPAAVTPVDDVADALRVVTAFFETRGSPPP